MIDNKKLEWEHLEGTEYWQLRTPHGFLTAKEPCKDCMTNGPLLCDNHKHLFNYESDAII